MAQGFANIVEVVMSLFVEIGGQGVTRGGGGLLRSAASRIGWASRSGGGRGGRLGGHSLGGHSMGSSFGGGGGLGHYDPKDHYRRSMAMHYSRGAYSGSGLGGPKQKPSRPAHLFGRSTFEGANSLSGDPNTRWVRQGGGRGPYGAGSYSPTPRSFIRLNK